MSDAPAFVPRSHEIEQSLLADLEPDAPLPSDAQLREEFAANRTTAQNAVRRALGSEPATAPEARSVDVTKVWPLPVERRTSLDQHGVPLERTETRYAARRDSIGVEFAVEEPGEPR